MIRGLLWFYIGYVTLSFALALWLFLSGVLTAAPVPLPYWALLIPSNVIVLDAVDLATTFGLFIYLGIVIIRAGLSRGFIPIVFVAMTTAGLVLLTTRDVMLASALIILAYLALMATYAVLASVASLDTVKILWVVNALLIFVVLMMVASLVLPYITLSYVITVGLVVKYMAIAMQVIAIVACTLEAWAIMSGKVHA